MSRLGDSSVYLRVCRVNGISAALCVVLALSSFSAVAQELPIDCGLVESMDIDEASGIAASRIHPGILWTHNDSGDDARLYAIDTTGNKLGEFHLEGVDAFDCEDIAVGPGPVDGVSYIYLADIGDNLSVRENIQIYRIEEPQVAQNDMTGESQLIGSVATLTFFYPDGARDAETLMVDPDTGDLLLITKREQHVRLYAASAPHDEKLNAPLTYLTDIPMTAVVGGDLSRDGSRILVKTYQAVYCWMWMSEAPVEQVVQDVPQFLPYTPEPQGEAICWDYAGDGYYTLSERRGSEPLHLYYYPIAK